MNLLTQIKHKTQKGEEVIMDIGAKASNVLPENFVEQQERSNLAAKDKLPVIFGKLSKWYTDLKAVAWSGSYSDLTNKPTIPEGSAANYQVANNDTTEAEGFVADARIVRTHGLEIDGLSRDLTRVNVYVGDDGKLHFVNSRGADSVLPFSAGNSYKGTFSDADSNRGNAVKIDLKSLIDWWEDVNLSVAVITNVSADNNIQSFSYATTKYDNQTGVLTITQSGGSRMFSGKFVVAKAGDENLFI